MSRSITSDGLQPAVLLVAVHVASSGSVRSCRQQPRRPGVELAPGRRPAACTGTARCSARPPTRMSCTACRNEVAPGHVGELAAQARDDLVGAESCARPAASARRTCAPVLAWFRRRPPVKPIDVLDRRDRSATMSTNCGQLPLHGLERDVLVGLDDAGEAPGVLLREEALGDDRRRGRR